MSDDTLIVDLSNYKDRVGSRVTPDRYRVQVEDAEATKSNAGNPMVNLWLRIVGGEFDGQTIVDRLTMTDKSMFRVVNFMQAIGLPTPKKRLQINLRQFIGKVLEIDVEDGEPYNGRIKSEVRGYMRVAKAQGSAADDDQDLSGLGEFDLPDTDASATDLPDEPATEEQIPEQEPAPRAASKPSEIGSTGPSEIGKASAPAAAAETVDDTVDLDDIEL